MLKEDYTYKYLVEIGIKPSPFFPDILEYAKNNLLSSTEILEYAESLIPKYIQPYEIAIPYYKNIKADSIDEQENLDSVIQAMDELMKCPTVKMGAIMPDACPTGKGQIPVGGVAVTHNAIHPSMHSADICCSVMMTNFGKVDTKHVLDIAQSVTHFGPGGRTEYSDLPQELIDAIMDNPYLNTEKSLELAKSHM